MTRIAAVSACLAVTLLGCDADKKTASPGPAASQQPVPKPEQKAPAQALTKPSPEQARLAEARAKLLPLKKNLMGALTAALKKGPPEDAIEACEMKAPSLTAAENEGGVQLGRSALQLRNPNNEAPAWVVPLMEELAEEEDPAGKARTKDLPDGAFGYVEAIGTMPLCTSCHGEELSDPVIKKLAKLYPEDQATGFAPGDFRGVFWVELPKP